MIRRDDTVAILFRVCAHAKSIRNVPLYKCALSRSIYNLFVNSCAVNSATKVAMKYERHSDGAKNRCMSHSCERVAEAHCSFLDVCMLHDRCRRTLRLGRVCIVRDCQRSVSLSQISNIYSRYQWRYVARKININIRFMERPPRALLPSHCALKIHSSDFYQRRSKFYHAV